MQTILPLAQVGAQFKMSSSDFEVVHVGKECLRITPIPVGPTRTLTFDTLKEMIDAGRIRIDYAPPSANDLLAAGLLSGLSESQQACLKRKLHYVHGMHRAIDATCSQAQIRCEIPRLAKELGDQDPPGASTVASWMKIWIDGGRQDAALSPRRKRRSEAVWRSMG